MSINFTITPKCRRRTHNIPHVAGVTSQQSQLGHVANVTLLDVTQNRSIFVIRSRNCTYFIISMILYKTFLLGVGGLNLNCCLVIIQLLSFFMLLVSRFILSLCFVFLYACFSLSFVCICHSVCAFYCVMRWTKIYIYYRHHYHHLLARKEKKIPV